MRDFTPLVAAGASPESGTAIFVAMRKLTLLLRHLLLDPRDVSLYQMTMSVVVRNGREMPCCVISCYVPVTEQRITLALQAQAEAFSQLNERYVLPESERPRRAKEAVQEEQIERFDERTAVTRHGQRARRLGVENTFTYEEWIALRSWFGEKCMRCGTRHRLVADHIVSMRDGGANAVRNIQLLCQSCNSRKNNGQEDFRDPAELAAFLAQLAAAPSP